MPGLGGDAALKHSQVELELITDIDMHQMMEKGVRGGVSMISQRYAEANDPRMGDRYVVLFKISALIILIQLHHN